MHRRIRGKPTVFDNAHFLIRFRFKYVSKQTNIIIVFNVYIQQIRLLYYTRIIAYGNKLNITSIVQRESLRSVRGIEIALIPAPSIPVFHGILHTRDSFKIEIVLLSDFVRPA